MNCPREMYGNTDITLFDKFIEVIAEKSGYLAILKEIKEIIEEKFDDDGDSENVAKLERILNLINTNLPQ